MKAATPLLDGRRVSGLVGTPPAGECTYSVVETPAGDKRSRERRRTRLRTGKVLDREGRFLTECLIYDRSETGGRLRLPAGLAMPPAIHLYDDQGATLRQGDVIWRTEREVGVRFRDVPATPRTRALEAEMRRRYYAVRG